jgi:type IV pilus assembly protein PilP
MKARLLSLASLALLSLLLAACNGEEHQDIKQWMNEATKDLKGRVPPLPEIMPFPVVSYDAMDLVDPFRASKIEPDKKIGGGSAGGVKPDFERRKEPLEAFPLESLKMVGLIQQKNLNFALIQTGKALYQVKIGNYMGQNFGIVTNITDSEVQLKELVQDSAGDWVERNSTLQLQEQETRK